MPPKKPGDLSDVDFLAVFSPLPTPISFVSNSVVVYVVGNSLCLWNIEDGRKDFMHTTAYSVTKICGNPARGLIAYCEGGVSPKVFVHSVDPPKLMYTLSDVTELEIADLAFSRCGSRLYTLSRATAKRMCVFSTMTGQKLPGTEMELPLRFDKISVYPGHKDQVALVRSSQVRIVTLQKSYETYISRLLPAAIPADVDLSVSAYAWTVHGAFVFATRQGLLVTLDGLTGNMVHACQVDRPITSILVYRGHMLTAHIGNTLRVWGYDQQQLNAHERNIRLDNAPSIDSTSEKEGIYRLMRVADLDQMAADEQPEGALVGQVAHIQGVPDYSSFLLTTAEGEVWSFALPEAEAEEGAEMYIGPEELALHLLVWFHTHPISDVVFVGPSFQVCASADEGGRLRIWEAAKSADPKGFRIMRFTSSLTSLAVDDDGALLAAGTDHGCVHLVNCQNWRRSHVIDSLRISEAGITQLCSVTHEGRCMNIAASMFNNKIAFLNVSFRDPKIKMLGYVDLTGSIEDISFHTKDFKVDSMTAAKLLVAGSVPNVGGEHPCPCLWAILSPPLDYEPITPELKRDVCPMWSMKLSTDQRLEDKATTVASATKKTVVVGFVSGAVKVFPTPTSSGPPLTKQVASQGFESLPPHDQLVTRLGVSDDGCWMVSSSMDGTIRLTSLDHRQKSSKMEKLLHNPYNGGVVQVRLSNDSAAFLSTGGSDGAVLWSSPGSEVEVAPAPWGEDDEEGDLETGFCFEVDDKDPAAFPLWAPTAGEERGGADAAGEAEDAELSAVAAAQRKAMMLEVEGLRKKLRVLADANNHCPEIERLERHEFCVDFEERDVIDAKARERCDLLRAQIEKENLARQLIRDRLIKEFWDPMRTKGCQICSLMSDFSVSNYPERVFSEEEQANVRKLRNMRQVERLEQQMLQGGPPEAALREDVLLKAEQFTSGNEAYVVNWWPAGGAAGKRRSVEGGGGDGEKAKDADASSAASAHSVQNLLYEPFELLTNSRRRLQIHLLQSLAAEYRASFNKLFHACQDEKKSTIDQIREKMTKIRQILAELQINEEVPEPGLSAAEDAGAVLEVTDKELSAERWVSEEERAAIAEAQAKEEERLRQLRENDSGQRALMTMMGGTLKTKKDLSALETTLEKEPWMDEIPIDEMTDLQRQAFAEFEAKEKALLEEQDKYRRQLDSDVKKNRAEVQELMQQFEGALKELHQQRFAHDAIFFCQELYCVRLQLALLQSVEDGQVLKQLFSDLHEAQSKLGTLEEKVDVFNVEVNSAREKQDERVRYEREVASAQHFRQQFAQSGLEPEAIASLLQIFRRRRDGHPAGAQPKLQHRRSSHRLMPSSSPEATPHGRGSLLNGVAAAVAAAGGEELPASPNPFDAVSQGDPYLDLGIQPEASKEEGLQEDEPADECPEGVDEANFKRMLELRRDRVHAEAEVHRGNAVLHEMGGLLQHFQKERDEARAAYERLQVELSEHRQLMDRELYDIEILFKLKQGQVEVPQAAVVTDYSDAVVIDQEVVESRNRRILGLGKDKINTLDTTKEFRKTLNLIHWEHKMLAMQTCDLEERTKDVHMLRVTKGLQSLLKGGEEGRSKADADLLERKIEHLSTTTQQKEQSLRKSYAMSSHATKLRKSENSMLEKKLRELQQNVIQREHIRRLRAPQGGSTGAASGKEGEKPRVVGGGGRVEENEGAARTAQASFREVKTRQSLMELAKKHTEEIDLLRKELDRLRQKTFPSFVQLHGERSTNPDHSET